MILDHRSIKGLIARGIPEGIERISLMRWRWDIAGDCQSPYARVLFARPGGDGKSGQTLKWRTVDGRRRLKYVPAYPQTRDIVVGPGTAIPYEVELLTRCRKCDKCRRARGALWRMRAVDEIKRAPRTWFGTLTLSPEAQHRYLAQARARLARQGVDFDALGYDEQFKERVRAISPEVTKFLKRVRKNSGAPLRYLWVAEAHKSGAPHFHALIHEVEDLAPVRHAVLTAAWWIGFTQFKLIDDTRAASYVAKYLTKSACARVRASLGYGKRTQFTGEAVNLTTPKTYTLLETF